MNFKKIGLMLDCSRNAVPSVKTLKKLIDLLSVMGFNHLELYTEDTYEIANRPYFGYFRGRYTTDEFKEVDSYAVTKGIELTPCIQALAHVNQIFTWPAFQHLRDCNDILLVDEPETYRLIEDMFESLSKGFTSRNVNIGCDEALMVGLGKFLDRFGFQNRFDIINRHIGRVIEIAKRYGFKCSMWSDMYFRLATGGEYYKADAEIPAEILAQIPEEISLIFWDYCSVNVENYTNMFAAHKKLNRPIQFAGGAWKWTGFAPDNSYSMKTIKPAIKAAHEQQIDTVMIAAWGDDGAEASLFSVLPALFYFSKACKGESIEISDLEEEFKKLTGITFSQFMDIELINDFPWCHTNKAPNSDKNLLYNDVFAGILDKHINKDISSHYKKATKTLSSKNYGEYSYLFDTILALSQVLELKADIGVRTRKIYRDKDLKALESLIEEYSILIDKINNFHKIYQVQWLKENKAFGFEIQDLRLGGLVKRI